MSGANLAGLLDGPARWGADRPAIVVGDEPVRTWAQFAGAVARRAGALRDRHGVGEGDAVALFAANHPAYLEALFAIWHAGAVAVPISSRLHAKEASAIVADSGARLCFATDDVAEPLLAALEDDVATVVLGDADDRALLEGEPAAPVRRGPADDAWIFFTSGTTGRPKGARLTHHNLFALAAAYVGDAAEVTPRDAIVHVAALSHASGLMCLPFVARGGPQVLPPSGGFDATEVLDLVAAGDRSSFFVPPVLLRRLSAHARAAEVPRERIGTILVGAAPVLPSDLRDAVGVFGPCVWNGYGQGESPCTITAHGKGAIGAAVRDGDEDALRSVGTARMATRVRVVDGEDRELPPGEVGEVVVDGPTVMAGYLDLPDATAETLRGGWLHTGDLGTFDERGRLTLVDRAKDVVISGGYNVYPREVEDVLLLDPAVAEAAVVGLPDPEWGERVVAFVVGAAGASVDTAALDRRCLDAIARHKRPKEYRVVPELPRNAAGKVLKKQLRQEVAPADAAR